MTASSPYERRDVLVKIENVSLSFGPSKILKPIDVEVRDIVRPDARQGQIVGVLGPSGIGKTQFSRILTGLQAPTTGAVFVGGKKVEKGVIGMVAQNYPLFAHRTVLGNLSVALEKSGLPKRARTERIMEYLARFGLSDKALLYPAQLSGGQRQRVSILREMLCSNEQDCPARRDIVMDEPFTGLDPVMKDRVCDLIVQVSNLDERNTIFVVAHDIQSLVTISDTLWLFGRDRGEDGRPVPGAYVKKTYDLIERGLAWTPGIASTRQFADFCAEVRSSFEDL
jgi:NitT/TauT family transport system ATP-binding protein